MKILLDANISFKLVSKLEPIFGDCTHVDLIGLKIPANDIDIWNYAFENGFVIITKDNDFLDLMELKGFPPKIVLLRTGNNSSGAIFQLLRKIKPMIEDLEKGEYGLIEIVQGK